VSADDLNHAIVEAAGLGTRVQCLETPPAPRACDGAMMIHGDSAIARSLAARLACVIMATVLLATAIGCANPGAGRVIPAGTTDPDQFLYQRGVEALAKERWLTAREYFKQLNETYVQSPLRPDAKIGVGDTYIGEGGADSLVLAINEFREFLSFYPLSRRADYAQYRLGYAHFRQMRRAQRDQTETKEAVREFEVFITRYPNSSYLPEVKERLREAKDRLGEAEFLAGIFYYRSVKYYPAAIDRFNILLKQDPDYTGRDAVYFYLGESLVKIKREAEALPYYEKLVNEFEKSEYLDDARKRIAELKRQTDAKVQS
jgi:outer membrane protein assembly factor BamD